MAQFLLVYEGWSQYRIAKEFAISPKILTRLANGEYEKKAPGRKPKFNEEHIAYILECAYLNPRSGAATIAQKFMNKFSPISISDQSVRNIIKAHDYRYLSARKIQKLNEVQIAIRYI